MKIAIKNGRIICAKNQFNKITDVAIDDGKIIHIGEQPKDFFPDKQIDATDCWVLPGLVDLCCRPQMLHPHGTTLIQEAHSAAKRGITSLCVPPDGEPIIDSAAMVGRLLPYHENNLPHIYPMGALTHQLEGKIMADMTALSQAGCIAVSNAQYPIIDLRFLQHCYDYAASFNLLVIIQPADPWLTKGVAHEGLVATKLGLPPIPETAETIAIAQHLLLIEQTRVRAHFTCLSSAKGVELIQQAKEKGLNITADTAMHSLHLTEESIQEFDANCHLYPPLRSEADKQGLLEGLKNGILDAICSDHRPLDSIGKLAPFADTLPGMSTIDTFFALGLELVNNQQIPLETLIGALTYRPANIANLTTGSLSTNQIADICVIDPNFKWQVEDDTLYSKGKNSAFKGRNLYGRVTHTIVGGQVVHE